MILLFHYTSYYRVVINFEVSTTEVITMDYICVSSLRFYKVISTLLEIGMQRR